LATRLAIRPDPSSFAERRLSELVELLGRIGALEPGTTPGSYRWRVAGAGPIDVRCDTDGDALREVQLDVPDGTRRGDALDLAAEVAGPLHWEILDVDAGTRHTPLQVAESARRRVRGRLTSGLAAISAAAAVLGGLMWRATGGGPSAWLLVAVLGIGVYLSLRAASWVRSRMRPPRV
jgi:hypothetical protein